MLQNVLWLVGCKICYLYSDPGLLCRAVFAYEGKSNDLKVSETGGKISHVYEHGQHALGISY
jgi:hypothetical protein